MTIVLSSLLSLNVFLVSGGILLALYAVRYICLKLFLKNEILPELYIAPRGLITILLFFAIPEVHQVDGFEPGILLYVIIVSSLVMTWALIQDGKKNPSVESSGEH